jgi:GxxExxY protein
MTRTKLIHDRLTYSVIGAFYEMYYTLGYGFLEHVYVAALTRELRTRNHEIRREVSVPVLTKEKKWRANVST